MGIGSAFSWGGGVNRPVTEADHFPHAQVSVWRIKGQTAFAFPSLYSVKR